MNKRSKIGIAVGASSIVMLTTAFSAMADTSAYDAYKSAVQQTKQATSMTGQFQVSVSQDGKQVVGATSTMKMDMKDKTGSGQVTLQSPTKTESFEMFRSASQAVFKTSTSDVYNVMKGRMDHMGKNGEDAATQKNVQNVMDTLFKSLDNYMTVSNGANGKVVSLSMSQSQIPAAANAVGSLLLAQAADHQGPKGAMGHHEGAAKNPMMADMSAFKEQLPKLTQDISIQQIKVTADINSQNYIDAQQADIVISGKDAAGQQHQVTIHVEADLSNFNATQVDQVNLAGKKVNNIAPGQMKHSRD